MSQEFNKNVLDLVKHPYEYMTNFEKSKKELASKEKYYSSLVSKKNREKEYDPILEVWNKFEMKTM